MLEEKTNQPNNVLSPTFSCFDDSLEFIDYVACEYPQDDLSMLTLVHGIFTGDDQKPHTHAWVEDSSTETAIFAGILRGTKMYMFARLSDYYDKYKFTETKRYTVQEALRANLASGHFGPWEAKYAALCGNGERTVVGSGEMRCGTIGPLPKKEVKQ